MDTAREVRHGAVLVQIRQTGRQRRKKLLRENNKLAGWLAGRVECEGTEPSPAVFIFLILVKQSPATAGVLHDNNLAWFT